MTLHTIHTGSTGRVWRAIMSGIVCLLAVCMPFVPHAIGQDQQTSQTDAAPEPITEPVAGDEAVSVEPAPVPTVPPGATLPVVVAMDVPSDTGNAISIRWPHDVTQAKPDAYILEMQTPDGLWKQVTRTVLTSYQVSGVPNFTQFHFRVKALYGEASMTSDIAGPIEARDHWFRTGKMPIVVAIAVFVLILVMFINAARRGVELFVRRISGLNAVEDAIGRATEMGKPVLYIPGTSSIEDVATLASLNILGEVVRRTVHYDVKIICPNRDPIVYTIAREIVRETYASEGRPDAFDPNSVFFLVPDQFAYAAGVDGIMVRQKPATIFFMGMFWAEALVMSETGAATGAVQIAGTDTPAQLPFFITSCDYTLIGEELYAASAYLSREPLLLGTLKAQDYGKLIFMICMVVFSILAIVFNLDLSPYLLVK